MSKLVSLAFTLVPAVAMAAAPAFIPVQGYLTDSADVPLEGSHDITLTLYDADVGGTTLFQETQTVLVDGGLAVIYLGAESTLDLGIFRDNETVYLGIQIGTDAEMTPRLPVGTAPFAAFAEYAGEAATLGGHLPADFRMAADNVAWSDLDDVPATLAGLTCSPNDVATYTDSGWDCVPGASFDTRLTEGDVELFVTNEAIDLFDGSRVNGAAISVDGHGHDFDQIAGTVHNSAFDAYSNLTAYDRLNDDADDDLLTRAQADGRFVNEGQADSISSAMIVDDDVRGADLMAGATGTITVSVSDTGADAYCPVAGTIKGDSAFGWADGDDSACIQAALDYAEANDTRRVVLLPGDPFVLTVPLILDSDIELVGSGGHAVQTALAPAAGFSGTELITINGDAGVWIHGLQLILDVAGVDGIGISNVRSFVIEDNLALVNSTAAFIRWEPELTFEGDKKVIRANVMKSYSYDTTEVSGRFLRIDNSVGGNVGITGLEIRDNTYNCAQAGGDDMVTINGNAANRVFLFYADIRGNVFDTNSSDDCNGSLLTTDGDALVLYSTMTNNRVAGARLATLLGAATHSLVANNVARGRSCTTANTGSDYALSATDSYGLTILGNHTTDYDDEAYRLDHAYSAIVTDNIDQNSNRFAYVLGQSREISIKNNGFYSYCGGYGNTTSFAPIYVNSDCDMLAIRENVWRLLTYCVVGDTQGVDWTGAPPATSSILNQVWL